jgi:hypothetical protein
MKYGQMNRKKSFKGRSTKGQKTHEEMLNIPDHRGNANQNHIKIPLHSC